MPIEITAAQAGANVLAHVAGKSLIQCKGAERRKEDRERLRQKNWRERVSLFEAIHHDMNGSPDCPASLMSRWLADCTIVLFDGIAKNDIYLLGERYGKLLATGAMGKADDTLRDRWLIFVIKEALAAARQIAITNKPYWRLTEASCELAVAALIGKESWDVAAEAAQAAQRAAQSAGWEAGYQMAKAPEGSLWPIVPAQAEEHSAKAAEAAAETAAAAAEAAQAALAAKHYLPAWAAEKAAEAARQAALGWVVAAIALGDRDQSAAEAAGEEALDAYFHEANQPAQREMVSAIVSESASPENAYRRMFDRLLDEIAAVKPEMTNQDGP